MDRNKALEVRNISKKYKENFAVQHLSFDIERGTIFGLLGPNGAGKTTLLRMITGILVPDNGEIYVQGQKTDLVSNAKFIGYMPEERGLYKKMRAEEQAIYLAQLKGLPKSEAKERVHYWFDRLDMNSWKNKTVEEVSKGMGQKLQFVCTVIHEPSLIILDEPFSGLDPLNADIIKNEIYELAKQGATIVFSTHRMEQVEEICQQIVLMNKGKIILNDTVVNAKKQYQKGEYILKGERLENLAQVNELYTSETLTDKEIKLSLLDGKKPNELLAYLSNQDIELSSLALDTPSLNEIFIELVKGDNS
ncbi:MAG: ABC transporter ATP-binding protein [Chitinophagales bacterium]|jgi:ABC-2 type transport system ATP-binding protein|nr:ATP-binding cassette domain-containing protein [Sphingobacteriales bacterium]